MRPMRPVSALVPLVLAALLAAFSQATVLCAQTDSVQDDSATTDRQTFTDTVEVIEATVDVLVTDRRGDAVLGLGPADFTIEEDDREVEIREVRYNTSVYLDDPVPDPETGELRLPGGDVPISRFFVLFFHDAWGAASNTGEVTRQLMTAARDTRAWAEQAIGPSDWTAVVMYDQSLHLLSDFTQDRRTILRAIDDALQPKQRRDVFKPSERRRIEASDDFSLLHGMPNTWDMPKEELAVEDALAALAEGTGHVVGRKNLVLFTLGTPSLLIGRRPDRKRLEPLVEAFNANDVAVYPVDLGETADEVALDDLLNTVADQTGGEFFTTSVSFESVLRRISETNVGYYSVTFRPNQPRRGGYREIEVDVRGRGMRVRARGGYLLKTD